MNDRPARLVPSPPPDTLRPRPAALATVALAATLAATLAACGGGSGAPATCTVAGVTVSATPATIDVGGTSSLAATLDATAACTGGVAWSASPEGGTLTPSGATATFTASTPGAWVITATSLDDGSKRGTATVTVGPAPTCGQPSGVVITHPGGTVVTADETWAGDGVTHHLPGSVTIAGTATVTIQPCAIVALGARASILVNDSGRLVAAGTGPDRFVEITAASTGVRWGLIRATHPTSLVDLRHTNVREGGETTGLPMMLAGLGGGYAAPAAPVLRVQQVEISGSSGLGVSLDQNAVFTSDSVGLTIKDCAGPPLRANLMALGSLPPGSYAGNATKEGADQVVVHGSGDLSADMTIRNLGVPYRFEVPSVNVRSVAPAPGPPMLTVEPGVVLAFPRRHPPTGPSSPGPLFTIGSAGNAPNDAAGVLHAVGTLTAPIVFTSGEAVPAAGDWQGLWLATAAGSRLDHVEIRYAGAPVTLSSGNCRPVGSSDAAALLVGNLTDQWVPPADLLAHGLIADSAGHGITAAWDAATASAGPDLASSSTFQNLVGCRQTFNGVTAGACPAGGGCTVP